MFSQQPGLGGKGQEQREWLVEFMLGFGFPLPLPPIPPNSLGLPEGMQCPDQLFIELMQLRDV